MVALSQIERSDMEHMLDEILELQKVITCVLYHVSEEVSEAAGVCWKVTNFVASAKLVLFFGFEGFIFLTKVL